MQEFHTTLTVNTNPIDLTEFPRHFLTQTIMAAVSTLKKVEEIQEMEVSFNKGKTTVTVNRRIIPLGPFPASVIGSTFSGLVSVLKGADDNVESFNITIG